MIEKTGSNRRAYIGNGIFAEYPFGRLCLYGREGTALPFMFLNQGEIRVLLQYIEEVRLEEGKEEKK